MEKVAGLQALPSSKFSHTNLLIRAQLQTQFHVLSIKRSNLASVMPDLTFLMLRTWNFACLRSFLCSFRLLYSKTHQGRFFSHVVNFGSCDQLLQKAYCSGSASHVLEPCHQKKDDGENILLIFKVYHILLTRIVGPRPICYNVPFPSDWSIEVYMTFYVTDIWHVAKC